MDNISIKEKIPLDIVILAGQSNAAGCGLGNTEDPFTPDPYIMRLYDPQPLPMAEQSNGFEKVAVEYPWKFCLDVADEELCGDVKRANFGDYFAREYKRRGLLGKGRKILVIRAACGSTGFCSGHWGLTDSLFRRMLDMTDIALSLNDKNRLVALLWHQGEDDAVYSVGTDKEKREKIYYRNFRNLVDTFRARYGAFDLPVIAGGFSSEWMKLNAYHKEGAETVIAATKRVLNDVGNGAFADASDLKSNHEETGAIDYIHFSRNSLRILGGRYFGEYLKITEKKQ